VLANVLTEDVRQVCRDHGEDVREHAVVEVNRLGRVTSFAYKPDKAASTTVATEVFVYEPDALIKVLEELHHIQSDEPHEGDDGVGDSGLGDFGDLLLPRFVERGKAYAHQLEGYWRDLGQPHHYLNAHLELLRPDSDVFRRDWPVRTQQPQREPAKVLEGASISDTLLSSGSVVAGTVIRSVIGPGVVVEAGRALRWQDEQEQGNRPCEEYFQCALRWMKG